MKTIGLGQTIAACIVVFCSIANAWSASPDQDDWMAARKASCPELIDAYKTTIAAERNVVAAMKESKDGTVAANVLGVASLAILGIGFFTWNDDASADENLPRTTVHPTGSARAYTLHITDNAYGDSS